MTSETLSSYSKVFFLMWERARDARLQNPVAQLLCVPVKLGRAMQLWSLFQEDLVQFIMRIVKDCLWLSCQPWYLDYSSLSCRDCHWTGCGDEHFHELVCEFLCTLLHCTGGDRGRFFDSGSLQPAWRKTKVVYLTATVVLCSTLHV